MMLWTVANSGGLDVLTLALTVVCFYALNNFSEYLAFLESLTVGVSFIQLRTFNSHVGNNSVTRRGLFDLKLRGVL